MLFRFNKMIEKKMNNMVKHISESGNFLLELQRISTALERANSLKEIELRQHRLNIESNLLIKKNQDNENVIMSELAELENDTCRIKEF